MMIETLYATVDRETLRQLQKDAERFAWLKQKARLEHRDGGNSGSWWITGIDAYDNWVGNRFDHKTFEGAIDAAMLAAQGERHE